MIRKLTEFPHAFAWILGTGTFLVWTFVTNFLLDPHFHLFLNHKTYLIPGQHMNQALWPWVVRFHILFASTALITGFVNFLRRQLPQRSGIHRLIGYVYLVSVSVTILTSGYLAPFATGGRLTSIGFNLINTLSLWTTALAVIQIRKNRVVNHQRWFVRSYVLCYLNPCIHLYLLGLYTVCHIEYIVAYTISVYVSAVTCIGIGEIFVRTFYKNNHSITPLQITTHDSEIHLNNIQ